MKDEQHLSCCSYPRGSQQSVMNVAIVEHEIRAVVGGGLRQLLHLLLVVLRRHRVSEGGSDGAQSGGQRCRENGGTDEIEAMHCRTPCARVGPVDRFQSDSVLPYRTGVLARLFRYFLLTKCDLRANGIKRTTA